MQPSARQPSHSSSKYLWSAYSEPGAVPDAEELMASAEPSVSGAGGRRAGIEHSSLQRGKASRMRLGPSTRVAWEMGT